MATNGFWTELRRLRSKRPKYVTSGERGRVFSAAMKQSEDLWVAAGDVSDSVSPMLMYYGLLQGATALSAANPAPTWKPIAGHGLSFPDPLGSFDAVPTLRQMRVTEAGRGFVQQLADFLSSPVLGEGVLLDQLVAALPYGPDPRPESIIPGPLTVANPRWGPLDRTLLLVGVPPLLVGEENLGVSSDDVALRDENGFYDWLSHYPALAGLGTPTAFGPVVASAVVRNRYELHVSWENLGQANTAEAYQAMSTPQYIRDMPNAVTGSILGSRTIFPALGTNTDSMHPLITWWTLLYAFSMLARYHPHRWVTLLDIDKSVDAIEVETCLRIAPNVVPMLLLREFQSLIESE